VASVEAGDAALEGGDCEFAGVGHEPVGARQATSDTDGHHAGRLDRLDSGPGILDPHAILD
jgi:hypothetical protein